MHPDITYENVSLPAARGRDATVRVLRLLNRTLSYFEIETHRLAVDGRIALWRDCFDWAAILRATATGMVRAMLSLITRRSWIRIELLT